MADLFHLSGINMHRYHYVEKKIKDNFSTLPKNQKKIAEYFLNNFDKIPFLNLNDLASILDVSIASIVRFSQRIGFKGYPELRDEIASSLQETISKKDYFPLFDSKTVSKDLLAEVANHDIQNINDTLHNVERDNFDFIIKKLSSAKTVYTAGLGISYLLAEIFAYQLTQVGINSSVLKHTHTVFNEQILFFDKNDLLIVFSFPPYSKETISAAEFAKERGIDVIAITNEKASPVTLYTVSNLITQSDNMLFTNSFAAIAVLINAIATGCALKNKQKAKKVLKESEDIMQKQDLIILESEK